MCMQLSFPSIPHPHPVAFHANQYLYLMKEQTERGGKVSERLITFEKGRKERKREGR